MLSNAFKYISNKKRNGKKERRRKNAKDTVNYFRGSGDPVVIAFISRPLPLVVPS